MKTVLFAEYTIRVLRVTKYRCCLQHMSTYVRCPIRVTIDKSGFGMYYSYGFPVIDTVFQPEFEVSIFFLWFPFVIVFIVGVYIVVVRHQQQ